MTRPLPILCVIAGLLPLAAWLLGAALGFAPDVQVLSGTLSPTSPALSALRGLVLVACWLSAAITGPPLVLGGTAWWLLRRRAQRVTVGSA